MAERVAVAVLMLAACGTAPPPRADCDAPTSIAVPSARYSIGAAAAAPRREGNGVGRHPHRNVLHRRQGGHRTLQAWPTSEPALLPTRLVRQILTSSFVSTSIVVAHPIRRSTSLSIRAPAHRRPCGRNAVPTCGDGHRDGASNMGGSLAQLWVFVRDESLLQCAQSAHGST